MPNVGSWNGKWTGAQNAHFAFTRCTEKKFKELSDKIGKSYYYDFGDGWGASIDVKIITAKEKAKIQKVNKGFMGYDWMIDSILKHGEILKS